MAGGILSAGLRNVTAGTVAGHDLTRRTSTAVTPASIEFRAGAKETILRAALNQGIAFPHNCRAGGYGECKCRLVKGKVRELADKSCLLSAGELCDAVLQAHAKTGPSRITRMVPLTHDILHVTVEFERAMAFTPGQYRELAARTGSAAGVTRRHSFANVAGASGNGLAPAKKMA